MKFIDFFSGIGGIRLGLELAGHQCLGFCEWDKYARQSYKAMFDTEGEFESHDVRTINAGDLPRADLWCFGFPCQDISIAGKQKGLENGERSGLFFQIMRLLAGTQEEDKPEWLLAENVRNLLSIGNGFDFLRLLIEMGRVGYDVQWQLLDSKDYGVAQHRERVFIIGHLRSKGRREVFPISPADGKNLTELHQVGRLKDANRENPSRYRVYDPDGLAPALTTMGGGGLEPCIVDKEIKQIGHIEGYGIDNPQAYRVYDANGIAPTLIRASDGKVPHIVDSEVKQIGHGTSKDGKPIQGYGVFDPSGLAPTLTTGHGSAQPYVTTNADIKVVGNYTPSGFHGSKVVDPTGIAPTVMENHGMGTAVVVNEVKCIGNKNPSGHGNGGAVYDSDGIAPTICCGDKSYTYVTCKAILTPDREEKRQNGRRMKEDGEPMFTLTTQDRHGVVIGSCYTHGKESSSNRPLMQNTSRAVLAEQRVGVAILKKERTEYGKEIRKAYETGEIQEQRKNMTQFVPRTDGISNTITTVAKDNYLMVEEDEADTDNNAL